MRIQSTSMLTGRVRTANVKNQTGSNERRVNPLAEVGWIRIELDWTGMLLGAVFTTWPRVNFCCEVGCWERERRDEGFFSVADCWCMGMYTLREIFQRIYDSARGVKILKCYNNSFMIFLVACRFPCINKFMTWGTVRWTQIEMLTDWPQLSYL